MSGSVSIRDWDKQKRVVSPGQNEKIFRPPHSTPALKMSKPSAKGAWQGRITFLSFAPAFASLVLVVIAAEAKARYSVVQVSCP
jgi:hypothetical protein